ncbi:MAG: hypothetical protein BWK73_50865 [Thiothrix lacustris]|uniref:Uncharacterized protein n=1 Tax=Thiothrix lacustris TaxID=525917 RepID=A0A1Y1Q899_9GAMM|nr:MAG: hypothetical protein BWK73_50865 [Thiothrix lacustris]
MNNHTQVTPKKAIDVSELASRLQADAAAIIAILNLFVDAHEEPQNEPLYGVITLTTKLMRDMEALYGVDCAVEVQS